MKKNILLFIVLFCVVAMSNAQIQPIIYKPFIPQRSSEPVFNPLPTYVPIPPPAQSVPAAHKVSEQIITLSAYCIKNDCLCKVQVREEIWSDNDMFHTMVGVKYDEQWRSVNLEVHYIAKVLSEQNIEERMREYLLQCNEIATHFAFSNAEDTVFLIGLRDNK